MPRFVYRALAAPGSDGPVTPLLCGGCEDHFSVWESQFAREIFHPRIMDRVHPVKYGPWLSKFAASVCWRILQNARRSEQLGSLQKRWSAESADCLEVWRDFLRGRRPEVGTQRLYLSGWDGEGIEPRAIAFEIVEGAEGAWVRTQMGPLAFVGLIGGLPPEAHAVRLNLEGKLKLRKPGGT